MTVPAVTCHHQGVGGAAGTGTPGPGRRARDAGNQSGPSRVVTDVDGQSVHHSNILFDVRIQ